MGAKIHLRDRETHERFIRSPGEGVAEKKLIGRALSKLIGGRVLSVSAALLPAIIRENCKFRHESRRSSAIKKRRLACRATTHWDIKLYDSNEEEERAQREREGRL